MSYFFSRIPHSVHLVIMSPQFLLVYEFISLLVFCDLSSLEAVQVSRRMFPNLVLCIVFLMTSLGPWAFGGHTREGKCSSCHNIPGDTQYPCDITNDVHRYHLVKGGLARAFHCILS